MLPDPRSATHIKSTKPQGTEKRFEVEEVGSAKAFSREERKRSRLEVQSSHGRLYLQFSCSGNELGCAIRAVPLANYYKYE
jgi:hypothetical protein